MFEAFSAAVGPEIVLVEVSPSRMPKQGTPDPKQEGPNARIADKFEAMAEVMQCQIDAKLSPDRLTNTHKRMREATSARVDGNRMQRTQQALRALARLHRAGKVPAILAGLKSKKAIHELTGSELIAGPNGYNDTGKPRIPASELSVSVWALLQGKTDEELRAEELADKIRALQFCKIPGYFPTPKPVIDLMLDHAQIEHWHTILEPSAGAGAIVDAIEERHGDVIHTDRGPIIVVVEVNHSLCEILQAKGYDARPIDFMQTCVSTLEFDRVIMNPPFEKLADIDHVQHAFERLKSGGRLVSVMSPGPFFRDTKKAKAFRAWFEELGGELIDLPEGSFKESGTGVASKLIVIDRP